MQDPTSHIPREGERERSLQRAIVLQTLRRDHTARWSSAELQAQLGDGDDPSAVTYALARLQSVGVLQRAGAAGDDDDEEEAVFCSPATRCLDELELIAI